MIALPFVAMAQLAPARPTPRIALLNAAGDQRAGQRAVRALRKALLADDQFNPLQPGPLANALELDLALDPNVALERGLARADEALAAAREAFSNLDEPEAQRRLRAGERTLVALEPRPAVIARLAELNFLLGLVHMRRQDAVSAAAAFRVAMRLAPDRAPPDPGVYTPDVIEVYDAAAKLRQAKTATVKVVAPFDGAQVFVDGADVGVTPLALTVEPGAHYFWGTMPDKQPFGARLTALVDEPRELSLQIRRIPDDQIAARVRAGLLRDGAPEPAELAAAAVAIYQLTLVKYVAVVTGRADDGLRIAVFDPTGRRLTDWAALTEESASDVVNALPGRVDLTPNPLQPADAGIDLPPITPRRPWYRQPLSYAAIGGGALIVVVGVLILTGSDAAPAQRRDGTCCEPFE